ncbi:MAG: response regulator [Deltaproteobacteria bacterium]|nr:response regulator [Deltaproteobacteria bacterium]
MIIKKPANILLADDSLFCRAKLSDILLDGGHQVTFAFDGAGVIDEVGRSSADGIDMLLLDLQMPHVGGFRVLEWMKENGYVGKFPIVCIMSARESRETSKRLAKDYGVGEILSKEFTHKEVMAVVNKHLYPSKDSSRREYRMPVNLSTEFKSGLCKHGGAILNISQTGLFLQTKLKLLAGTLISLEFTLPDSIKGEDVIVNARGEVMWSALPSDSENRFVGAGIRFKGMSVSDKRRIDGYLAVVELRVAAT